MKRIGIPLLFFLVVQANAQVGVNTPLPKSSLEITASNQTAPSSFDGLLVPRVAAFATTDPGEDQSSMIVFLTKETTYKAKTYDIGYYYWDNASKNWIKFTDANSPASASNGWLTTGNNADKDVFFGTINSQDIRFRVNNLPYGKLTLGSMGIGFESLGNSTSSSMNSAIGYRTLANNSSGEGNVAIGFSALYLNTTGSNNTALGDTALNANTTMNGSVAVGYGTLKQFQKNASSNSFNTAVGFDAQTTNIEGLYNTAIGANALKSNLAGNNTALGASALAENVNGSDNIGIGVHALLGNKEGSNNIHIGNRKLDTNVPVRDVSNSIVIGNNVGEGNILDNTIYIGGPNIKYFITSTQMAVASDKRFKEESTQKVPGLAFITKLRPVTYYWDYDKLNKFKGIEEKNTLPKKLETGFMAQEVEQAAKEVNYDFSGVNIPENAETNTYTLKYAEFVVPLVQAVKELDQNNQSLELESKRLRNDLEDLKKLVFEKLK